MSRKITETKTIELGGSTLSLIRYQGAPSQIHMVLDDREVGVFMIALDEDDQEIGWDLYEDTGDGSTLRPVARFASALSVAQWLRSSHLAHFLLLGEVIGAATRPLGRA